MFMLLPLVWLIPTRFHKENHLWIITKDDANAPISALH